MNAEELAQEIGGRIMKLRTARGLTQAQVAENTGTSLSYVGMMERGLRLPHIDILCQVADAFDVPVSYFLVSDPLQAADLALLKLIQPLVTVVQKLDLQPADVLKSARVVWALHAPKGQEGKAPV